MVLKYKAVARLQIRRNGDWSTRMFQSDFNRRISPFEDFTKVGGGGLEESRKGSKAAKSTDTPVVASHLISMPVQRSTSLTHFTQAVLLFKQRTRSTTSCSNQRVSKPKNKDRSFAQVRTMLFVSSSVEIVEPGRPNVPPLDSNAKEWDHAFRETKLAMGSTDPIHAEDQSRVDHILRVFDLEPSPSFSSPSPFGGTCSR